MTEHNHLSTVVKPEGQCPACDEIHARKRPRAEYVAALRAQVLEYEHALEHVVDCGTCGDCKRLAQSALAGEGRDDFRGLVDWRTEHNEGENHA